MRKLLISIMLCVFFIFCTPLKMRAAVTETGECSGGHQLYSAKATAYCLQGRTCDGTQVREGIAAAKSEWYGKTLVIYQKLPGGKIGKIIGIYEVKDSGGTEGIKKGYVIDIWRPDLESCQEFMNLVYEDGCKGNVYVDVIDADG